MLKRLSCVGVVVLCLACGTVPPPPLPDPPKPTPPEVVVDAHVLWFNLKTQPDKWYPTLVFDNLATCLRYVEVVLTKQEDTRGFLESYHPVCLAAEVDPRTDSRF